MASRSFWIGTLGVLGAALALLVSITMGSGPAEATFPGQNGKIAFARGGDVWTMDPDGTDQTNLTNTPSDTQERYLHEDSPAFSPDGTEIAFVREDFDDNSRGRAVWVMNADGSGQRRLMDEALFAYVSSPNWSPDGEEVAFFGDAAGGRGIFAARADGSGLREVVSFDGQEYGHLAWSPDGDRFAMVGFGFDDNGIYVASADGSGPPERIVRYGEAEQPSWSPDGERIAAADGGGQFDDGQQWYDIYAVDPDGSDFTRLTETDEEWTYAMDPAWSPDGGKIAFVYKSDDRADLSGVYTMDPDGSDQKLVAAGWFSGLDWGPLPASAPQEDATDPTITRTRPATGSEVRDRTATIRAVVRDETDELAKADISLRVDGRAKGFSYDAGTDRLSRATKRLDYGRHTVEVEATDGAGNEQTERWSFRVVRR